MTEADFELQLAQPEDAAEMVRIIHASFGARRPVDPPAAALSDTVDTVRAAIESGAGLLVRVDGRDAACLLISFEPEQTMMVHRVSVHPDFQHHGIAPVMVRAAAQLGADAGLKRITLLTRREFPELAQWWSDYGFEVDHEVPLGNIMAQRLPVAIQVPTAEAMQQLGERLAGLLAPGDLLVANGELGAGKTTLTQGIGRGLGVQGPVISPTFVLSRIHPAGEHGIPLVHVDAYRLGSAAELEDIDLDASLPDSVTLVEWGAGLAEGLASDRLEIDIRRSGDPADETRTVYLAGIGPRWAQVELGALR